MTKTFLVALVCAASVATLAQAQTSGTPGGGTTGSTPGGITGGTTGSTPGGITGTTGSTPGGIAGGVTGSAPGGITGGTTGGILDGTTGRPAGDIGTSGVGGRSAVTPPPVPSPQPVQPSIDTNQAQQPGSGFTR